MIKEEAKTMLILGFCMHVLDVTLYKYKYTSTSFPQSIRVLSMYVCVCNFSPLLQVEFFCKNLHKSHPASIIEMDAYLSRYLSENRLLVNWTFSKTLLLLTEVKYLPTYMYILWIIKTLFVY